MRSHGVLTPVLGVFLVLATAVVTAQNLASILAHDRGVDLPLPLTATVVAIGIPGAGAIAQAGTFHKGGPFAPGGALAAASHPVLDRTRLLAASTSNFGAPLARPLEAPGSILSLDLSGGPLNVPPLWRVADRAHFLHDGRAQNISEAIALHGGQAAGAAASFRALGSSDLQALLDFLSCI